jgi:hypothetical protein
MSHFEKVKGYLVELGHEIKEEYPEEGMFVINNEDQGISNMVLDCEDNLLVIEQKLLEVAVDDPQLFKQLLQTNRNLIFGSFVLDETGKNLIFRDTLELENLDLNELESSLSALAMGLVESMDLLVALAGEEDKA